MTIELTAEEKAYIESGGQSGLPDDYASEMKPATGAEEPQSKPEEAQADGGQLQEDGTQNAAGEGAQDKTDDGGEDGKGPVSYGALKEERERRKKAEQQAKELQDRFAIANERLTAIVEAQTRAQMQAQALQAQRQQPTQQGEDVPDPNDPLAVTQYLFKKFQEKEDAERRWREQQQQQSHQQQHAQRIQQAYVNDLAQERERDPSFNQHFEYLFMSRYNELKATGIPEAEIGARLRQDEFSLANEAMQRQIRPAEMIKRLAMARGYQSNPAPAQPQAMSEAEKLARVSAGQAANSSLSKAGTSGNARPSKIDINALAEMSDKEWDAFYAKNGMDGLKEAMGG